MATLCESTLLAACRLLFGDEVELNRDFLAYLQPEGAKAAYRARAKEQHPDRFADRPQEVRRQQTERFQDLGRAYHLLRSFFDQRQRTGTGAAAPRPAGYRPTAGPSASRTACYPHPRVPPAPIEFGRFLFHRGKITYQELIAALLWQRRQRPRLGAIARRWGWLDEAGIERILRERAPYRPFGSLAVALGYLNPTQVQVLVRFQRSLHRRLGDYFVDQGIIAAEEIERLAKEHREHNRRCTAGAGHARAAAP